ncbi:MAG TPA: tautomerase family protein [Opitutaceae bacterium]|nr:tautomerase family protein [Opitutaceae bacterium]
MPLVTISFTEGVYSDEQQRALADSIHSALVSALGVPETDRFQRLIPLKKQQLIIDSSYPSLSKPRTVGFVLVEVLLSVGRSVKLKKLFLKTVVDNLQKHPGVDPDDVMIVLVETAWENWAFSAGVQIHV